MRIRRKLVAVALLVGTTVATGGVASPVTAGGSTEAVDDKGSQVVVVDHLKPDTTMEEIQESLQKIVGQPLSPIFRVTAVEADKNELTSEQIEALLAGKEASGVKLLGEIEQPKATNTLADVATVTSSPPIVVEGGIIVLLWVCETVLELTVPDSHIYTYCYQVPVFLPT